MDGMQKWYSTDGVLWTPLYSVGATTSRTDAAWAVHNNNIFGIGGYSSAGAYLADVWRGARTSGSSSSVLSLSLVHLALF
jgi:hypothetical protein